MSESSQSSESTGSLTKTPSSSSSKHDEIITFLVGPDNERIQCRMSRLTRRSPVFKTMFSDLSEHALAQENTNNIVSKEIKLPDTDCRTFETFMNYFSHHRCWYSGLETEGILDLYKLAQKYDVFDLMIKCEELLQESLEVESCVQVYKLARFYEATHLMKIVEDFMTCKFEAFTAPGEITKFDEETLMILLPRDDLEVPECELIRVLLVWAASQVGLNHNNSSSDTDDSKDEDERAEKKQQIRNALKNLIPLVRFPSMSEEEFTYFVKPAGILSESEISDLSAYYRSNAVEKREMSLTLPYNSSRRGRQCMDIMRNNGD